MILFGPHDNRMLYEAHIPQATLKYSKQLKAFRRKGLEDSTSMVMSPVDIQQPDFNVCTWLSAYTVFVDASAKMLSEHGCDQGHFNLTPCKKSSGKCVISPIMCISEVSTVCQCFAYKLYHR